MIVSENKFFPWRIFARVVLIQSVLVLFALAASGFAARHFFKKEYLTQLEDRLKDSVLLLSRAPGPWNSHACTSYAKDTGMRVTVARRDGSLLCDSHGSTLSDNIAQRPEIAEALQKNIGTSTRRSSMLGKEMLYRAIYLPAQGVVVRAGFPLSDLQATVRVFDASLGFFLGILALVLGAFSLWTGKKLVFPMGRLLIKTQNLVSRNPPVPMSADEVATDFFGEWSELESNIDDIRKDLEAKARSLDTERVELATLMGSISDAILAVDLEGKPLFYNSRFKLLFKPGEHENRSTKLWEIFRDPEILDVFNAALREGRMGTTRTIQVEIPGGPRHYFSLSVSPLRRDDRIYGAVGIFHDVSELKAAEQMRIDFVANVSHELRTPLTSIKGYTETLLLDLDQQRPIEKEFLLAIARNSNRLMALMEDLLDLSSIESAPFIHKDRVLTEDLTHKILKQLAPNFHAKRQTVASQVDEIYVWGDGNRIEQVLINLLDNASKYTPEGGRIDVRWSQQNGETVLTVRDSGPGIAPEHHARLFERFYRVDKARSREHGGTGLGLAIVKHIMQRHGGTVNVESALGKGAVFSCRFPVQ